MKYFNVASDFKTDTINQYDGLNQKYEDSKILETFGQISIGNEFGSGRPGDMVPKVKMKELEEYVRYSKRHNIEFNYTFNALCLSNREFSEKGLQEIGRFLDQLYEIGVTSLTVAIPAVIDFIKRAKYPFEVKASTLCDIVNATQALEYKKLGADRIVIKEAINRDFDNIKRICESFGDRVEAIVNVICDKNCIYRTFHQIQGSLNVSSDMVSPRYYSHKCMMRRMENIDRLLKLNWIRPEDLHYYEQVGIHHFKIQGRHNVKEGNPVKTVESYMQEKYDGNLMELLDNFNQSNSFSIYVDNRRLDGYIEPFYNSSNFCKDQCNHCGYCESYANKCINKEEANEVMQLSRRFYEGYDQFNNLAEHMHK